jgi:hypothetical protein
MYINITFKKIQLAEKTYLTRCKMQKKKKATNRSLKIVNFECLNV